MAVIPAQAGIHALAVHFFQRDALSGGCEGKGLAGVDSRFRGNDEGGLVVIPAQAGIHALAVHFFQRAALSGGCGGKGLAGMDSRFRGNDELRVAAPNRQSISVCWRACSLRFMLT